MILGGQEHCRANRDFVSAVCIGFYNFKSASRPPYLGVWLGPCGDDEGIGNRFARTVFYYHTVKSHFARAALCRIDFIASLFIGRESSAKFSRNFTEHLFRCGT